MAANSSVRSLVACCNQRSFLYHFPILLRSRLTHRRHPYQCPLSLNYFSTQFVQESTEGDSAEVRSRLNVVNILEERGLLESLTSNSLRSACSDPSLPALRVYCGFDPTAESLHLGNLLGIIVLSWFLRCGHKVVALVGGATGRVGDPSGKSIERPELDLLALDRNVSGISTTISRILGRNHEAKCFTILNNFDWWKDVKLLDFLKEVGRFARMGVMMSKESVRKRLESEQGMSYTEFTYQLLQGYDFLRLFRDEDVNVQIGGSDQWGNITAGTDLIRRLLQADGAYGLTFPLLLQSDGTKFGKSEDGAIWLSPSLLSPYQFYQYLFSVPDSDVVRFLKILTFLSMEEIVKIEREMQGPSYVPNTAQRRLAEEVTLFVHGEEGLDEARKATEALRPGAETKLVWRIIEAIAEDVPSYSLPYDEVLNISLLDLTVSIGLLESKSAARRLLKQGGLYLNNSRVHSEEKKIEGDDIVDSKVILLSAGKKNKMIGKHSSSPGSPLKNQRHSHSKRDGHPKKDGCGGKGTWGGLLDTDDDCVLDLNDPNYSSNEEDKNYIAKKKNSEFVEYKKKAIIIVEEYFANDDAILTANELIELEMSSYNYYFVKKLVSVAMDRHDKEKEMLQFCYLHFMEM